MFARPTRGRGYNNFRGSTRKKPIAQTVRGLFADGVWHCDCQPRLPAERFQVKKEGKNKGKWFYTCQQEPEKRCKFFLWAEDAHRREADAVLNNSRTEPRENATRSGGIFNRLDTTPSTSHQHDRAEDSTESEPEPSPSRRKADNRQTNKRTATMAGLDQDEDFDNDFTLSAAEADALVKSTESVEPETPVKVSQQNVAYATPATTVKKRKLPWQMDDSTLPAQPVLKARIDELLTPAKTPQNMDKFGVTMDEVTTPMRAVSSALQLSDTEATPPRASAPEAANTTPDRPIVSEPDHLLHHHSPPQRYYDALANPDDSNSPLATEVFAELSGLPIPQDVMMKVRSILSKHELKSQGILKGRDMTRVALKTEQETTRMLQRRIQTLENDLALQRALKIANKASRLRQ